MASEMPDDGFMPSQAEIDRINQAYEVKAGTANPEKLSASQATRDVFDENAPAAARGIVALANTAQSERVRLSAQQYVVDRVLGKVAPETDGGPDKPLDKMFKDLMARAAEAPVES